MAWLVVTGKGSWNYGGHPYRPGVHEVEQEVADAAILSKVKALFVTDLEPEIMSSPDAGQPLSLEDIRVGTTHGPRLKTDDNDEEPPEEGGRVFEFPCPYCPKQLMSSGSLARHIEFNHELIPQA